MPEITVVIPTFNRAASLARLLAALSEQEPPHGGFEVIVVDDGSTDETAEVARSIEHVAYLRQANAGPAAARNLGWRAARASVVAFTDDDTVPSAAWLRELLDSLPPEAGAVGGRVVPLAPGLLSHFVHLEQQVSHGVDTDGSIRYLVTANCAWRRSVLEQLGGFDERFRAPSGEDTDLTMRALTAGISIAVTEHACVAHDDRASLSALLSTYFKHGRSRAQVMKNVPGGSWDARRKAMVTPRYWIARYRYYREAGPAGPGRALAYLALRAVGLCAYALGLARSRFDP